VGFIGSTLGVCRFAGSLHAASTGVTWLCRRQFDGSVVSECCADFDLYISYTYIHIYTHIYVYALLMFYCLFGSVVLEYRADLSASPRDIFTYFVQLIVLLTYLLFGYIYIYTHTHTYT